MSDLWSRYVEAIRESLAHRTKFIGMRRLPGWTGELAFYSVWCPVHREYFETYPQGWSEWLVCPRCREDEEYSLRKSEGVVGQLQPVILDASGKPVDGLHRLEADPTWRTEKHDEIKTEEDYWKAQSAFKLCEERCKRGY